MAEGPRVKQTASWVNNLTATTDPSSSNDSSQGYDTGSLWVNSTGVRTWICIDPTASAAKWREISRGPLSTIAGRDVTGRYFIGTRADYPNSGGLAASELQYTRIWIEAQTVLTKAEVFVNAAATGNINIGLYDQATPTSANGTPRNLLASTGSTALSGGDNGTYKSINLSAPYTVTSSGYYWIATIGSSNAVRYATSNNYRAAFLDGATNPAAVFEAGSGVTLPAGPTHTFLASAIGAIIYVALSE